MAKHKYHNDEPRLFKEKLVPAEPGSDEFFKTEYEGGRDGAVECLGKTFPSDEKRREYFIEKLREKLKDPAFRKIEGFPIGADEDILALSDPPYYTACPNPFIADFIKHYGKPYDPKVPYSREPFAADVSEGKNDPIYNAHSYHTKVPHKAIMRYILHYTEPGDVVFDGFCGTGMTGVAAQMCGNKAEVESLGYRVDKDGTIFQQEIDDDGKTVWNPFSRLGVRRAILNDLSPAATFIAYNYNTPVDVRHFEREAKRILKEVENECGWMYETLHTDGKTNGRINYTVWSDVFVCPECTHEVVFWEAAMNRKEGSVKDDFPCPHCKVHLTKRKMDRAWVTSFDKPTNQTIKRAKQVPVLINYTIGGKQRMEKAPDKADLALIEKIKHDDIPYWFPTDRMMEGGETRRNDPIGITHVHHFYTKRNLWLLAALLSKSSSSSQQMLCRFLFQQWAIGMSLLNRYSPTHFSQNNRNLSGTLYVGSHISEVSPSYAFHEKLKRLVRSFGYPRPHPSCITQQDAAMLGLLPDKCSDYVFIDPPFGSNLNYSELNFLWESWLKVRTNNISEAIENDTQSKGINEYRQLMSACFEEAYRVLKPGRWMTVEFSNTKASIWNSIQTALTEAGFIVANVSALDKQQLSFKAVTTPTAVKQDLVISAYKPNGGFEERFGKEASSEEGVWDFVRTHLKYLPVTKLQGGLLQYIPERDPRILYDQMVAYYVRKGYPVPLNSSDFQSGLAQRFIPRDGMFFLPEQAAEHDRKKMQYGEPGEQWGTTVVDDEQSAISWLMARLKQTPQPYNEIQPDFMPMLSHLKAHERDLLSLDILLADNFLRYDGTGLVPEQIHSYLSTNWKDLRNLPKDDPALRAKAKDRWYVPDPNKVGDLEKLRERSLLKEFEDYRTSSQKRLKVFRLEAVRAGFKKAWQDRDYDTIIVVAQKIPEDVLQEDSKLLMWYDQAMTRKGDAQ